MRVGISLTFLMLGVMLSGCSSSQKMSVWVINQDEIQMMKKGDTMTAPYDGTFYSKRAESRIMDAKIMAIKLK